MIKKPYLYCFFSWCFYISVFLFRGNRFYAYCRQSHIFTCWKWSVRNRLFFII